MAILIKASSKFAFELHIWSAAERMFTVLEASF